MASRVILLSGLVALIVNAALALDNNPILDFCVADTKNTVLVNGYVCKDPKTVQAEDFYASGFHIPTNTSNQLGFNALPATAAQIPGLNTFGISAARIDYAPGGIIPPHSHPRATEILIVLEGSQLEVGFVTSNPENRHITKVIGKGDVFVFPVGLIHYQRNNGSQPASGIVAFSSQNPGVHTVANVVFGSNPEIATDILAKAFQVDNNVINQIKSHF
ncbi:putative germin-like protein 2-1 [Morella rubra]|uniref:Germin-like protein n=1 Tax=Morella rubra TaxID=262757 RepID=A0A6A1UPG7_9ROSI|nr:putative germin-like protein 2-1 [Morella rubra]